MPATFVRRMKYYTWNPEKNKILKKERNVGFDDVVLHIEIGDEVEYGRLRWCVVS